MQTLEGDESDLIKFIDGLASLASDLENKVQVVVILEYPGENGRNDAGDPEPVAAHIPFENLPGFMRTFLKLDTLDPERMTRFMNSVLAASQAAAESAREGERDGRETLAKTQQETVAAREALKRCRDGGTPTPPPPSPEPTTTPPPSPEPTTTPPPSPEPTTTPPRPNHQMVGTWHFEEVKEKTSFKASSSATFEGGPSSGSVTLTIDGNYRDLCPGEQETVRFTWSFSKPLDAFSSGDRTQISLRAETVSTGAKCKGGMNNRSHLSFTVIPVNGDPELGSRREGDFSYLPACKGSVSVGIPSDDSCGVEFTDGQTKTSAGLNYFQFIATTPDGDASYTYVFARGGITVDR